MSFNTPYTEPKIGDPVSYRNVNLFLSERGKVTKIVGANYILVHWRGHERPTMEYAPNIMLVTE